MMLPGYLHESVDAVVNTVPSSSDGRQLMASFTAYFDESGTHAGSPVVAVAGFISTIERWRIVEKEWRTVLRMYKLDYFHMTDFENRRGPYQGWADGQRQTVIKRLLGIIKRYVLSGFSAAVVTADYDRLSIDEQSRLVDPYTVCAFWCIRDVGGWLAELGRDDRVAHVFERGIRGAPRISEAFGRASDVALHEYRFGTLHFADKRSLVPLQAADILAYEVWKHVPKRLGANPRPTRKPILSLLSRVNMRGNYFTYDTLRRFVPPLH